MPHAAQASPGCNSVPSKPARHTQRSATSAELEGHAHSSAAVAPRRCVVAPAGHARHSSRPPRSVYVPSSHCTQVSLAVVRVPAGQAHVSTPLIVSATIIGSAHAHAASDVAAAVEEDLGGHSAHANGPDAFL